MNKIKDLDLYLLLDISHEASEKDIKKAYRKKALKCHPDKNPDDPNAALLFHQLQEALAVLTDTAARKAYDNVLKARKANELRNRQLDEKRKRLKDQLEARESEAAKEVKQKIYDRKSDEEKLAAEIERVMKEGRKELEAEQERLQNLIQKEKKNKNETSSKSRNFETEASTKLKVRWKSIDKKQSSDNLYTVDSLKSIFSKYGDVNVVVISESSTAVKGSALIEMAVRTSAEMASSMETGFEQAPLKVKLLESSVPSVPNIHMQASNENVNHAFSSQYTASNFQDHETLVLRKMRQAEERKKLEQEIREQDELENA